jgi:hypothetical protein
MTRLNRALVPAVWLFYVAIVFEILYMVSPFALYYYSAYGLWLKMFHQSSWTTPAKGVKLTLTILKRNASL